MRIYIDIDIDIDIDKDNTICKINGMVWNRI